MRLNRAMGELEKLNGNARQAVLMADEADQRGDTAKAAEYTDAAEAFANRLIQLENEIDDLKTLSLQSAQAADQAKAAVAQNARALQQKLAERQKLLSQLDQAKMQEQMNTAMATLSETVGEDVPTFDEVRDKIEARYAKAKGMAELTDDVGRVADARDRGGHAPTPRPGPPVRDAGRARPRPPVRRPRSCSRRPTPTPAADERQGRLSVGPGRPRRSAREHHEVVAVDDLVRAPRAAGRRCAGPATSRSVSASTAARPLANTRPSGPATSTASSASNSPSTPTHAGRQQRDAALDQRPAGAVVDDDRAGGADGEGDPQLAGRQAPVVRPEHGADARRRRPPRRPARPGRDARRSRCARPTTRRSWPPPASRPCRRCPGREPVPPAATSSDRGRPRRSPR